MKTLGRLPELNETVLSWNCFDSVIVYGFYRGIHHHVLPPFGRICWFYFFQASNKQIQLTWQAGTWTMNHDSVRAANRDGHS